MASFLSIRHAVLCAAPLLALSACGGNEEQTYETDVTDLSGGELIVTEETPGVPVNVPETPMTPVPAEEIDGVEVETVPAE